MCGICGYIHLDQTKRVSEGLLKEMAGTLVHRGPDDMGVFADGHVGLGHRRLSIIDLQTGHQPMFNEDGTVVIVYNGEVYNFPDLREELEEKGHKFITRSDTEVIIHAYEEYGEDCLDRFNGMFSFALWDKREKRLFLARDRFGQKPLYYGIFNNQFVFGSELKALVKHPDVKKEVDVCSVIKYLAYDYIPAPSSIFKNIYKLKAGHHLTLKNGTLKTKQNWDYRFKHEGRFDLNKAESHLLELFKDAVKRRLISDVPLGVFLSGGIDSSMVVAMMAELMSPKEIKTFTIGFKEKPYDESTSAELVARHFGTDHHQQVLAPDDMLDVLPDIVDNLDEPFADSSIVPTYLVSKFARRHVKVALGGDGGDELFAGYRIFLPHKFETYYDRIPDFLKNLALKPLPYLLHLMRPSGDNMSLDILKDKYRRFSKGMVFREPLRHQVWMSNFPPDEQEKLFSSKGLDLDPLKVYSPTVDYYKNVESENELESFMYIHIKTYLTDDILAKVDKASMANSLEVRAPFLDVNFSEFAGTIPSSYKLHNLKTKWILKKSFMDKLPLETLRKPKHGFAVPIGRWFKRDLKGMLLDAFKKDKIRREGIFDPDRIEVVLKNYQSDRGYSDKAIWSLFMFEMWYNKWMC